MLQQEVLDALPAHIAVLDRGGNIVAVNRPWVRFAEDNGSPQASKVSVGASYVEVCRRAAKSCPEAGEVLPHLQQILSGSDQHYLSLQYACHSPSEKRWFLMSVTPLREEGGGAVVSHLNISGDRLSRQQLAERARSLISAQEEERRRIARELHDDLNQLIGLLAVDVGLLREEVPKNLEAVRNELGRIKEGVVELSTRARRISHELHPAALEYLGLVAALRGHCEELNKRGVEVNFSVDNESISLPRELGTCLFRIAQEALRNAVKHSGSGKIEVQLRQSEQRIELEVVDHGKGFKPESARGQGGGLGLLSMEERALLVNGRLAVQSQIGKGTCIRFQAPLERTSEDGPN